MMMKLLMGIAAAMALCVGTAFALEIESPAKNPAPIVAPTTTLLASANLPVLASADVATVLRANPPIIARDAKLNLPMTAAATQSFKPKIDQASALAAEPVEPDFTGHGAQGG
jgi:hypothetical protein